MSRSRAQRHGDVLVQPGPAGHPPLRADNVVPLPFSSPNSASGITGQWLSAMAFNEKNGLTASGRGYEADLRRREQPDAFETLPLNQTKFARHPSLRTR
jgi:hypothetical protein